MKYAVIKLSGREFKVAEGDLLKINKITTLEPKVVLYCDGDKISVGTPYLSDVKIDLTLEGEAKGKKLKITRFKAKSRYDKTIGYRPSLSLIRVNSIGGKTAKTAKTEDAEVAAEEPKVKAVKRVTKAKKAE